MVPTNRTLLSAEQSLLAPILNQANRPRLFIRSQFWLDYCNSVFYSAPNSTTAKLQRAQNCLARVVLQRQKSCYAQPLLESLHWLPISHQINFMLATLTYKRQFNIPTDISSSTHPPPVHRLFNVTTLSEPPLLQVPRARTAYGSHAFSVAVPNMEQTTRRCSRCK